ncbi:MAG: hypothetical protein ACM3H7_02930 [Acidobacteriaceae bacterium]
MKLGIFDESKNHLKTSLLLAKDWFNPDIKALALVGIASLLAAQGSFQPAIELATSVASKPTTWNETRKQARLIIEEASFHVSEEEARTCRERGEEAEIQALLLKWLEALGENSR